MLLALLLAAQQPAPPPERFSILVPTPPHACVPRDGANGDVVVCGNAPTGSQQLPLPDEAVPSGPVASNPHLTGTGALRAEGTPCAASQRGCQVGFGPPIAPIVGALVGLIKDATARRPDKRGRVPIDLSEPAVR